MMGIMIGCRQFSDDQLKRLVGFEAIKSDLPRCSSKEKWQSRGKAAQLRAHALQHQTYVTHVPFCERQAFAGLPAHSLIWLEGYMADPHTGTRGLAWQIESCVYVFAAELRAAVACL